MPVQINTEKQDALDHSELLRLIHYDPDTGAMTWKVRRGNRAPAGGTAGCIRNTGYWYVMVKGKQYLGHRLAWFYVTGAWPADTIDHVDRDRTNNRFSNLRCVSNSTNNHNKPPSSGVFWTRYKWGARIFTNGKAKWLGAFSTPEEAHEAYLAAKSALAP